MEIILKKINEGGLYVKAIGKLDIDNSAEYGMKVKDAIDDVNELVLDFAEITYIASIGLRILLELYQQMSKQGSIKLINVQEPVLNVLKMTGFDKFLSIS
jgi:anti-sigma B factor antagonist